MAENKKQQVGKQLKNRLDWAEKTIHAMLHGGKPAIDPNNPKESWLFDQMTRMYKAGFLCEEPKCYLTLPDENLDTIVDPEFGTTLLDLKGVTLREPLPKILTSEEKNFAQTANEHGIYNYKIFGTDEAYRYPAAPLGQVNDADAFILPRGGLMELYQYVCFLRAGMESDTPFAGDKLFIVQNSDSYWKPFIDAFGKVMEKSGHRITNTRHDSAEELLSALGDKIAIPPKRGNARNLAHQSAHIYVVTGTGKKVQEYRKVFNRRGTDVRIKWFHEAFPKPEAAEEFSYSYVGNLIEKFSNLYSHISDTIGVKTFRRLMAEKGSDIDIALALLDDSGFETRYGLTSGPEFAHAAYRLNNYRDFGPGPELKNIMSAMQNHSYEGKRGTRAMVRRMFAAAERIQRERADAGEQNSDVVMNVRDRVVTMLLPFKEMVESIEAGKDWRQALEDMPIRYHQATTESTLVDEPRPNVPAVDTKYFLVPNNDPEQRTQAENINYVPLHGYTAQVVKSMARTSGFKDIENNNGPLSRHFTKASGEPWRLGTQHSLHKGRRSTGLPKSVTGTLTGLYRFMAGNGGMHDCSVSRDHKIKDENNNIAVMTTPLNNFDDFARKADGFILTPDSRHLDGDKFFWERAKAFIDLVVGKQIKDKAIISKPFFVMDCGTWRPFLDLFNRHAAGLIPEMPEHIFSGIVKPDDPQLVEKLNNAFSEYEPDQVPQHFFQEGGKKAPEDKFLVTIYCSASTTDGHLKAKVRDYAVDLAAYGFAVRNGGGSGRDGLMVETSRGVKIFNETIRPFIQGKVADASAVPLGHVSSIQCQYTKEEEGIEEDAVDYWAVYPTIYQRMHVLQDCDAELVLPGGAGTFQEIINSVIMRKNGFYPVKNRPIVILNENGDFDAFLKMVPEDDFERYNIRVVKTWDAALELLKEARRARGMEQPLPYTEEEYGRFKSACIRHIHPKAAVNDNGAGPKVECRLA